VTADGETGYWDNEQKQFVEDADAAGAIEEALSIAKEERAPDLIVVPVPAAQGGRS
jgi:sirohydrochlorin ferrochelatase